MALALPVLKEMLETRFPTTADIGRVIFLKNPDTKLSISITSGDIGASTLMINDKIPAPGVNEPDRSFDVGTRFQFTNIAGIVSTPQVVLNRIYHVLSRTADDITIGETPLDLPANGITFTAATGMGVIEELFISETISTNIDGANRNELSQITHINDAVRYEAFLGAAVTRPLWRPNAISFDRRFNPAENTLLAIMTRAQVGNLTTAQDAPYDGVAFLIGGNDAIFDSAAGDIAYVQPVTGVLQSGLATTLFLEIFLNPIA